jgi:putative DNA primase/helicase
MVSIPNQHGSIYPGDANDARQADILFAGICPVSSNDSTRHASRLPPADHSNNIGIADAIAESPDADEGLPIADQRRPLHPNHLADLHSSGLTDETIQAAGLYSETDLGRLTRILGWNSVPRKMSPSLVFPYFGVDGANGYCRIKPDDPRVCQGKPVKYESPKGRSNQVYLPPGSRCRLDDTQEMLLITEGEKKALALDQEGFVCVGLVGVWGWKVARQQRLLPELETLQWRGCEVRIVFDSDIRHNPDVQNAETMLAAILRRAGACVRVVRLPDGPADEDGNPTKLGVDDYIVANGINSFQGLLEAAEAPAEPNSVQMRRPGNSLDPCDEVRAFLRLQEQDSVCRLRHWRGSWYQYGQGFYAEMTEEDVQGMLVRHLNESANRLTTSIIGNHKMQLKAQAGLASDISPPAWIADPLRPWAAEEVLACRNELVHLPSLVGGGEHACPATPRFFTPVALDYDFAIDARPPTEWLRFLSQLWPDDPQSIATLQEWFGYCLTLDTRQQKILMMVGPKRSGKGTIARVLTRLVGGRNVAGPTLSSLSEPFGLEPLLSKSVAIISDARLSSRTDGSVVTERLLSISGEDSLSISRKYTSAVQGKLDTRLMFLSNELPRFSDVSGALAGRMIILRLTRSWYGVEDGGLFARLVQELPGILLWAIEGWRQLRARGHFVVPESSREVQQELEDLTSPAGAFIRQCCEIGPELSVPRNALYTAYQVWCRNEGMTHVSNRGVFGRDLRTAVATLRDGQHHDGTRLYLGVGLRAPAPQHTQQGPQQVTQQVNHSQNPVNYGSATHATGNS